MNTPLSFPADVQAALSNGDPVVALESTIITHGMPWPQNRDTALAVEQAVRDAGATPATIAVLNGELFIGLDEDQLESLAKCDNAWKLSRADLAMAVATGRTGSTTVAATMIAAKLAGIRVFATGGIGGVHRGAESSFDVSADLNELARTDVAVICAGAKAILDLPKTFETLETLGVPVLAWQQDTLPAFWSRETDLPATARVDDVETIVDFLQAREQLGITGGVLITNPVPEADQIPASEMNLFIDQAIAESEAEGIRGKGVTPWLLGRIVELSDGRSLRTNQALIRNNANLAGRLAVSLATAARGDDHQHRA